MARRTKDELRASNYYEWLQVKDALKAKKKAGFKLTAEEKELVRLDPTPDKPYLGTRGPAESVKRDVKRGTIPTKDADMPIVGGSFVCPLHGGPHTDENCMLFCDEERCPFYGKGYMRSKGIKF